MGFKSTYVSRHRVQKVETWHSNWPIDWTTYMQSLYQYVSKSKSTDTSYFIWGQLYHSGLQIGMEFFCLMKRTDEVLNIFAKKCFCETEICIQRGPCVIRFMWAVYLSMHPVYNLFNPQKATLFSKWEFIFSGEYLRNNKIFTWHTSDCFQTS